MDRQDHRPALQWFRLRRGFGRRRRAPHVVIRNDELAVTVEYDLPIARHIRYGRPNFISIEAFIVLSIPPLGDRVRWSYRYSLSGAHHPTGD